MNKEQLNLTKVISKGVADGIVTATKTLESSVTLKMTWKDHADTLRNICHEQTACSKCPLFAEKRDRCMIQGVPSTWILHDSE